MTIPYVPIGPAASTTVTTAPETVDGKPIVRITRNDSYDGTANGVLAITVAKDFSGWTGTFTIRHRATAAELLSGSVTVASSVLLTVSLTAAETDFTDLTTTEDFGPHPFDIQMASGSARQTILGIAIISRDQTTS